VGKSKCKYDVRKVGLDMVDEIKSYILKRLENDSVVPECSEISKKLGYSEAIVGSVMEKLNILSDQQCASRLTKLKMSPGLRDEIVTRRLAIYKDILKHSLKNGEVLRQADYISVYGRAARGDIKTLVNEDIIKPSSVRYSGTLTQQDMYDVKTYILQYFMENHMSPTVQELRVLTGRNSKYVQEVLSALEMDAFIKRNPGKHRAIVLITEDGAFVGAGDVMTLMSDLHAMQISRYVKRYIETYGKRPEEWAVSAALNIPEKVVRSILKIGEGNESKQVQ
jgi:SOS-response transcriptional repressor LexA